MRFGGHQTFFVREGWLAKGLGLLRDDATAFDDPYVADQLGVGRNMAKSIEHWLLATGIAERSERRGRGRAWPTTTDGYRSGRDDRAARSVVS